MGCPNSVIIISFSGGGEIAPGEKKVCWQKKSRRLFEKKFSWREFFSKMMSDKLFVF